MKLVRTLLFFFIIGGCTSSNTTNELIGKWININGGYLIFEKNGKLYGYNIPHRLFPKLEGIKYENFDFIGEWDFNNKTDELWLHLSNSSTIKLSFGCPIYIKRNGLFENEEIDYLFLLDDIESEAQYRFDRNDKSRN